MNAFYAGLGLIIIGTGFFKANVSTMVGQIYKKGDARRDAGFTIFYVGINTGAFLGPIICGYLAQSPNYGWHYGFAAAGVGMVLGLIGYLWGREKYLPGIGVRAERSGGPFESAADQAGSGNPVAHGSIGAVLGGAVGWFLGSGSFLGLLMG